MRRHEDVLGREGGHHGVREEEERCAEEEEDRAEGGLREGCYAGLAAGAGGGCARVAVEGYCFGEEEGP